jgi:hypothetical protein
MKNFVWMLRHVALVRTDNSEELRASFIPLVISSQRASVATYS